MSNKKMVSTETENKLQRKVFVHNKLLECVPRSSSLPNERLRWNTNEEIASYLISLDRHEDWLSCSLKTRPKNGSIILYNRKKVKYRKDGYCWKKRKDGKTTREDHMKLKVQGMECLYGNYVHSSIVPTFHRRCYWLLQNPDIVLVHYLNVPSLEDSGKCSSLLCSVSDRHDSVRWSRDDLLSQLKPMFHSMKHSAGSGDLEDFVQHVLDRQRPRPQPRTHTCLCSPAQVSSGGGIPHRCSTKHRIISPKLPPTEPEERGGDSKSSPASSPCPASTSASPPPQTHSVSNHAFYGERRANLATVALPQNAVIVMATAAITGGGGGGEESRQSVSLPCSGQLLLSPSLPPTSPPSSSPAPPPVQLALTLLPSPVLGGLLLTPSSSSSLPTAPPSPAPKPLPQLFDPDSFLNSPTLGQTYGGLPPPLSSSILPPSPPSLTLSLSPTFTPPSSVSPPSSLSSLSSSDSPSSAPPPPLTLSPNSSVAPPPLPLCLELGALGGSEEAVPVREQRGGRGLEEDEGSAPPTKLALLQTSSASSCSDSAPLLLIGQDSSAPPPSSPVQKKLTVGSPQAPPPTESSAQGMRASGGRGLEEAESGQHGAELNITFDSQFTDLISDLITEVAAQPAPPAFPAGVRYVVPPQPSPSSSFLPFPQPLPAASRLTAITDFSPEWSYPEGGVKVLITGPWSEPVRRYSCVFDQSAVGATMIQPGVLRCYCPAHEAGLVCLQVLESGGSVSSSVLFEYRARNASSLPSAQLDWLSLDDNQFRMSILERLEQMERRMAEMARDNNTTTQQQQQHGNQLATPPPLPQDQEQSSQWFERRIVCVCERMMRGGQWSGGRGERLHNSARHRGMTLLHLAAAQGYTHLIHTLITWRSVNSDSLDLEQEVDALNVDHFSCTPLMWACALGHQGAAELLYGWNTGALGIPDSLGRLPLAVARSRGHTRLATVLEELHTRTPRRSPQAPPSPDTGLSSSSSLPSSPGSSYSSGPTPMDVSPSSPSSLSTSSLSVSPPLPLPALSELGVEPDIADPALNAGRADDSLYLMDFEAASPGPARRRAELEEQLLSYGENAENEGEEYLEEEVLQVDMAALADHIIEATPERIKQDNFSQGAESPLGERRDNATVQDTWLATYLETVDAHSPPSTLALQRLRPPSSAAWAEFLNASANGKMERDFALLTLTDGEQRELYEAARIIQNAFRRYKGRRLKEQQDVAAAVIQRCYRKYKQLTWIALKYALYKKMTQAAILIQSKFRSYYEQKRFQQSRRAAVLIQQYYRSYKQAPRGGAGHAPKIRGSFLTKKQDQAARKIMRFLRRCRHRIKELKQSRELERRGLTT